MVGDGIDLTVDEHDELLDYDDDVSEDDHFEVDNDEVVLPIPNEEVVVP